MTGKDCYIFTGGPGAGKTTVIELLRERGHVTVPESARLIIRARIRRGLEPRPEPVRFASEILARDIRRYDRCRDLKAPVFLDRGIPDALGMLLGLGEVSLEDARRELAVRSYNNRVFFFPPWQTIYTQDAQRDQDFDEAVRVANRVANWYEKLGFQLVHVPLVLPLKRLEFVLDKASERIR